MSSTESIISKTIETETGKYVIGKIFKKFDSLLEIKNREHEISDALNSIYIPNDPEKRARLEEKIIDRYLKFKTINSDNVDIHIDDIYHPLQLVFCDNGTKDLVDESFTLTNRKITCLIGKAGQGKTTLLRKLVQKELNDEKGKIPLLIILRDIDWDKNNDVCDIISLEFDRFGVNIPKESVKYLLQFNRLFVCFDGFDEVKDEYRRVALQAINDCFSKYDCQTVVTTRPGTQVTISLDSSRNVTLSDLTLDDVYQIIDTNKSIAENYKQELKDAANSKYEIRSILLTPIIVDIFILVYGSMDAEPNTLTEFYGQLFSIIINKHDKFKFLTRQSQSGLDNSKLHDVFCNACFQMIIRKVPLDQKEDSLRKIFAESCDYLGFKDHNDLSHFDIVDKTSLIKRDGDYYSFIHKTILEYHAARCIADLDSNLKEQLYNLIVDNYDSSFENVLSFVKDIDPSSFYKFFVSRILKSSHIKSNYNFFDDDLLCIILSFNVLQFTAGSNYNPSIDARLQYKIFNTDKDYLSQISIFQTLLNIIDYPRSELSSSRLNKIINDAKKSLPILVSNGDITFTQTKEEIEINSDTEKKTETIYTYNVKVIDLINLYVETGKYSKEELFSDNINNLLDKLNADVSKYIQSTNAQSDLINLLKPAL
ncbi:NACHT domain-containing protein [Photobacterium leiognathi]|uniref:NACHT domain-containing protein n=1 Tax=Photobacterium leiognathi TaxID=553611 RepID=UPI001EE11B5C|nr:NACHT domain-containing protein [Photobacterium leiognathi]MCG3885877.1 NACHT domain-containing protein [Photobacterium leiognathi]